MKARLVFRLSLSVIGLCILMGSFAPHHPKTLQVVGLIATVTCLAAAYAIPKSSGKEKSQD